MQKFSEAIIKVKYHRSVSAGISQFAFPLDRVVFVVPHRSLLLTITALVGL